LWRSNASRPGTKPMSSERLIPSASSRSAVAGTSLMEAGTSNAGAATRVAVITMSASGGVSAQSPRLVQSAVVPQSIASPTTTGPCPGTPALVLARCCCFIADRRNGREADYCAAPPMVPSAGARPRPAVPSARRRARRLENFASRASRCSLSPGRRRASLDDLRRHIDGKAYRARDEAEMMGLSVQGERLAAVCATRDRHPRLQLRAHEGTATIGLLLHRAAGLVPVVEHDDPIDGAEVQVPEHVTAGKARDQQLLGVVARRIAAERGIARAGDHRLARHGDVVIPPIAPVGLRATAVVAGPGKTHGVLVLLAHAVLRDRGLPIGSGSA